MQKWLIGVLCLGWAASAGAQTFLERAALAQDDQFRQRIGVATMQVALVVAAEAETVSGHETRLVLAKWVIREPDASTRQFAIMASAVQSVTSAITDAALKTLITDNWTMLSSLMPR